MSAFFDFSSLITVLLLMICTTYYIREMRPTVFDHPSLMASPPSQDSMNSHQQQQQQMHQPLKREGITGFLWKLSRIGERLSPYVGAGCALMALHVLFFK